MGDDAHPHGPGPLRRRLTDPAKANDAQRRSGQRLTGSTARQSHGSGGAFRLRSAFMKPRLQAIIMPIA